MKSFDTDLKKYTDKIKLKATERKELRERVLSYMEYHPLPKQESVSKVVQEGIISESFIKIHFNAFQLRVAGGVLLLLLILTPVLAERSVPGEVLYILKTGVNEKIQAQLANSPYEKIEFETKLMERRIAEARILASEGKLTEKAKDQLEETVKGHAHAVQEELTELRTRDADSAAIAGLAFNTSLEVQSTVLTSKDKDDQLFEGILVVVNGVRDESTQRQNENKPSYIGLVARVEEQTTRAYELFESVRETASAEEIADIERRLSDINRLFGEAKAEQSQDESVAVTDLTAVLSRTQKLITFMSDLDLRTAVALEELVPIVLSDDERLGLVRSEVAAITTLQKEVSERLEIIEEEGVVEKVGEGLVTLEELLITTETAVDLSDIDTAENLVTEGRMLIDDLNSMTTQVKEDIPVEQPIEKEGDPEEEVSTEEATTEDEDVTKRGEDVVEGNGTESGETTSESERNETISQSEPPAAEEEV